MGITQGKLTSIFGEEYNSLNRMLTEILKHDNTDFNPKYYSVTKDLCDQYSMVLESSLKKHLRVELLELKDSIYLIPKMHDVTIGSKYIKKDELCHNIADHYKRILKILISIKELYNIEQNGEHSIAGICSRVMKNTAATFQINYCDMPHVDYTKRTEPDSNGDTNPDLIDLNTLGGLRFFTDKVLSRREKNIFLRSLKNILAGKYQRDTLKELLVCGDDMISSKSATKMFGSVQCNKQLQNLANTKADTVDHNSSMKLGKYNPIFMFDENTDICFDKKQIFIQKSLLKRKDLDKLHSLYDKFLSDYKVCVNNVTKITERLIEYHIVADQQMFSLRDVGSADIDLIEHDLKENVSIFFYSSLYNYHSLLEFVKGLDGVILGAQHGGSSCKTKPRSSFKGRKATKS
jgi:hypothetical protein